MYYTETVTSNYGIENHLNNIELNDVISKELRINLQKLIARDQFLTMLRNINNNINYYNNIENITILQNNSNIYLNKEKDNELLQLLSSLLGLLQELRNIIINDQSIIIRNISLENNKIEIIEINQKRLRSNLEKLKEHGNSTLVRRYLDDMNRDEDNIIISRNNLINLENQKEKINEKINLIERNIKNDIESILKKCDTKY